MTKERNSKHSKYSTGNPISNVLVNNFFKTITNTYLEIGKIEKYIEAGCGEGLLTSHLLSNYKPKEVCAFDIDENEVSDARKNLPDAKIDVASVYQIPHDDSSFDLVVCCEVLEHLEEPNKALSELKRIAGEYLILSVPNEPIWRLMNMVRFKYWNNFGNTPGHLNNWSKKQFVKLISNYFEIIKVNSPLPWTIILCKKH
ncbi:MAG: class I SAM-dependent methyltransferase [Bacteroidales bacterium]|nr:class I SAM-dependent methyltransferase [Bacteroidales bacterium]